MFNFLLQGTETGQPQFMEEVTWNSCGLGNQPMPEDRSTKNGKKAENSPLLTPAYDLGDSNEDQVAQVWMLCVRCEIVISILVE